MIRVTIKRAECIMCGACWAACPDLFEAGDDGLSQITPAYRVAGALDQGEAPDEFRDCAEDAAASCPVEIIHVTPNP